MALLNEVKTAFFVKRINNDTFHVVIEHPREFIALSDTMPVFYSFGLYVISEETHHDKIYRHTYTCQGVTPGKHFLQALDDVWHGVFECDDFNQIIITTSLPPHSVNILRAYARYLHQISFPHSLTFIASTLAHHPDLTHLLWQCLEARLDPNSNTLYPELTQLLRDKLTTTDMDVEHIFNTYIDLFSSTLRMQSQSTDRVSFKLQPRSLCCLPNPKPFYESFVYSPRFEGIHMRWGKVARGGIRWSERNDYRYEVLELVKAQTLKNSVIVPTGAKGGFICRLWNKLQESGADPHTLNQEKAACYELFIKGLLDLVDLSPTNKPTFPHNEVDAYFVVAADKGTATFSDLANKLAKESNFWLNDAFASGGSNGYDHKKMGITAKGARVSLEHHCKRLNLHPPFTFVGVGDMSGDVLGNGLLHSVKLLAAFDHRHIFIDPNPNVDLSLQERRRLFDTPQSTWTDYNKDLISQGGGVFDRHQPQLSLSPEASNILGVEAGVYPTNDVVQMILKAPVHILWFGGIGTFVKGPDESHHDVRDRTNDNVRINGNDIKASIVVEGANLGATQAGRVAYALEGGVINTDATDNSAGVDCSDHEVNIKIFLRHTKTPESEVSQWLESMTGDVTELILKNNTRQNDILTVMEDESPTYEPLRQYLKKKDIREGLPRGLQLLQRPHHHWTRPELCYLLAYMKNDLTQRILDALPSLNMKLFENDIIDYFPPRMRDHFGQNLCQHPLRESLLATVMSNHIINTWGPMWALPTAPLEKWLPAYHQLRSMREPHKEDSKIWQIFITYLMYYAHQEQIDQAYKMVWGKITRSHHPLWQEIWLPLLKHEDIPAVWDLGAVFIKTALHMESPSPLYLPTKPSLADLTHAILSLAQKGTST